MHMVCDQSGHARIEYERVVLCGREGGREGGSEGNNRSLVFRELTKTRIMNNQALDNPPRKNKTTIMNERSRTEEQDDNEQNLVLR